MLGELWACDGAPDGSKSPVMKSTSDKLIAVTLNTAGSLVMRSERVGSQTVLAGIVQLVAKARRSKSPVLRMTDHVWRSPDGWIPNSLVNTSAIWKRNSV